MDSTITLQLNTLTPHTLAVICAALTRDAARDYELAGNGYIALVYQAQAVEAMLVTAVGDEKAAEMLQAANAVPEWLFKHAPAWHHAFVERGEIIAK